MPKAESYVYFEPSINLAHMSKGGKHRVTKAYADDLLKQNPGYGRIVGDAPSTVGEEEEVETWELEMSPADYIERYRERYASGDVSDTVRSRYELATRLMEEDEEEEEEAAEEEEAE